MRSTRTLRLLAEAFFINLGEISYAQVSTW
jgi:hypothetical protein